MIENCECIYCRDLFFSDVPHDSTCLECADDLAFNLSLAAKRDRDLRAEQAQATEELVALAPEPLSAGETARMAEYYGKGEDHGD